MTKNKRRNLTNKGFTLVELIIVLVILAILAAILTPTLLGYIDEAKTKRYLPNAQACMDAARAAFVEQYAKNGEPKAGEPVIPDARKKSTARGNNDQDISNTDFAKGILNYAGVKPYFFMVAVGSNSKDNPDNAYYIESTLHDKYTIYYGVYVETKGAKPLYFYNGEWSTANPTAHEGTGEDAFNKWNVIRSGPLANKRLQYYLIINQNTTGSANQQDITKADFWNWLKAGCK